MLGGLVNADKIRDCEKPNVHLNSSLLFVRVGLLEKI